MVTRLRSDPELAALVVRAREQAESAGELQPPRTQKWNSALNAQAREAVGTWVQDGGYDQAVAEVVADDPDLADQ